MKASLFDRAKAMMATIIATVMTFSGAAPPTGKKGATHFSGLVGHQASSRRVAFDKRAARKAINVKRNRRAHAY